MSVDYEEVRTTSKKDIGGNLDMKDSAPFMMEQFNEASDKVTAQAKKEVEAFVHTVAERTGFEAIRQMTTEQQPMLLEEEPGCD